MNAERRSIVVCIPTYTGEVDYSTEMSLGRAFEECAERGWRFAKLIRARDALVTRARDVLVAQFLETDGTDLLFWDADVACRRGSFSQLMSWDVNVVAGMYREKREPESYTVRSLPDGTMAVVNGLMEVAAVPTGFLRLRRGAVERMVEARKDHWYKDATAGELTVHHLFYTPVIDHKLWSEDFALCRLWREELGGKIYVDPYLTLYHTGKTMFTGNFGAYLEANHKAPPEEQPQPADDPAALIARARAALA